MDIENKILREEIEVLKQTQKKIIEQMKENHRTFAVVTVCFALSIFALFIF